MHKAYEVIKNFLTKIYVYNIGMLCIMITSSNNNTKVNKN